MKRLATIGAVGTIMMLSVTPITIAHADPINNDTVILTFTDPITKIKTVTDCTKLPDDDRSVNGTRCNFPNPNFKPTAGSVWLTEDDKTISDILWTHFTATNPHFHYVSEISGKIDLTGVLGGHKDDFTTDPTSKLFLGSEVEKAGDIDLSAKFGLAPGSVVVTSDVPEPATLSLLLVGLAGLGYRLRRRKL